MINWKIEYSEVYVYICIYTVKYVMGLECLGLCGNWMFDFLIKCARFEIFIFIFFFSSFLSLFSSTSPFSFLLRRFQVSKGRLIFIEKSAN